jgi:hypothetical protein
LGTTGSADLAAADFQVTRISDNKVLTPVSQYSVVRSGDKIEITLNDARTVDTAYRVIVASAKNVKDVAGNVIADSTGVSASITVVSGNASAVAADKAALQATYAITANGTTTLPTTGTNGSTITWAETLDTSNVGALATNVVTVTRSATDDTNDVATYTATLTKGASTATQLVTFNVTEAKLTTVTTQLPTAGTFTATGTQTLVFSEELNTTSKAAVKAAVDAKYTAGGTTATYGSAWGTGATANTLTITLGGTMDATPNNVVSSVIAPIAVTDLAGNTSAALAVQS